MRRSAAPSVALAPRTARCVCFHHNFPLHLTSAQRSDFAESLSTPNIKVLAIRCDALPTMQHLKNAEMPGELIAIATPGALSIDAP
jgi:hypothetical protein